MYLIKIAAILMDLFMADILTCDCRKKHRCYLLLAIDCSVLFKRFSHAMVESD